MVLPRPCWAGMVHLRPWWIAMLLSVLNGFGMVPLGSGWVWDGPSQVRVGFGWSFSGQGGFGMVLLKLGWV